MLSGTTFLDENATRTWGGHTTERLPNELLKPYEAILAQQRLSWTEHHHFLRRLGQGGQGVVFLSERRGTDDFTLPVAIKVFSPEPYPDETAYGLAMGRMAQVAARVAEIQQDNLLDVHNWVERDRIRFMEMEWVDGLDLGRLLSQGMLDYLKARVSAKRWNYINQVIITAGPMQPRFKPGIAIAIVRDCLAALARLHRVGIVHGDLKPANIMLKRTGNAKVVDLGSAFELKDPPLRRTCTPFYAAPEVLEERPSLPQSDLASLGYVLVEMLSGIRPFAAPDRATLLDSKRDLVQRLPSILPEEVQVNELLMTFLRGLVATDPARRFPSALAADLIKEGAAAIQRQLIFGNLASEYDNEIALWLDDLEGFDQAA